RSRRGRRRAEDRRRSWSRQPTRYTRGMEPTSIHTSVLPAEVMSFLAIAPGMTFTIQQADDGAAQQRKKTHKLCKVSNLV
ncbi:MAG: hypothetical protein ACKPKO_42875, partial [Candidatus Fonsibacter sp.]